jgi:hypothetical protein
MQREASETTSQKKTHTQNKRLIQNRYSIFCHQNSKTGIIVLNHSQKTAKQTEKTVQTRIERNLLPVIFETHFRQFISHNCSVCTSHRDNTCLQKKIAKNDKKP